MFKGLGNIGKQYVPSAKQTGSGWHRFQNKLFVRPSYQFEFSVFHFQIQWIQFEVVHLERRWRLCSGDFIVSRLLRNPDNDMIG